MQKLLGALDSFVSKAEKVMLPRTPAEAVAMFRDQEDERLRCEYATDPDPAKRLVVTKAAGGPVLSKSAFELITDPNDKVQWNRAFDLDHGLAGDQP
jgi:hypothetical protein